MIEIRTSAFINTWKQGHLHKSTVHAALHGLCPNHTVRALASVCLILTVRLADADSPRTGKIAEAAGLAAAPKRWWSRLAHTPAGTLNIPGPDGGCGCSFLADSADWDAMTWDMIPDSLPRLASILRTIRQHTTTGFSFEALWIGETPAEERRTTFDELLRLVEQSKLGTKTRYLIEYAHAP